MKTDLHSVGSLVFLCWVLKDQVGGVVAVDDGATLGPFDCGLWVAGQDQAINLGGHTHVKNCLCHDLNLWGN